MAGKREYEKHFDYMSIIGFVILVANLYYYAHPLWRSMGLTVGLIDSLMLTLRDGGVFRSPLLTKTIALVLVSLGVLSGGKRFDSAEPYVVAVVGILSALLYLLPFGRPLLYMSATLLGFIGIFWTIGNLGISGFGDKDELNDRDETFNQCRRLVRNDDSINIPILFRWQHKMHKGWINIVNPFRGTLVVGTPGSGKSFSVYGPMIEQFIAKGFSMFVYDYKYPDLTRAVYNELLIGWPDGKRPPQFCTIDFNDPIRSNRCNPLAPYLMTKPTMAFTLAEAVMKNIQKKGDQGDDFFINSAINYMAIIMWFLKIYRNGIYCTFPHVIELMCYDYKKVFPILASYPELESQMAAFLGAYDGNAQEQLQGQLATGQIPIVKFITPNLYWIMSGDDFSLEINDPDAQKIFCVGNDSENRLVYGTTIALIATKMFSCINKPGRARSAILLDELPTVYLKGLDHVINTARSNKVAVVMGVQDISQLTRDYGEKEANVIFNSGANLLCGQVNGDTAEKISKIFGSQKRVHRSLTEGDDSRSINISFENEELLPRSVIETFSQGMFCGKVADDFRSPIRRKLFCGMIQRDPASVALKEASFEGIPVMTDFGQEEAEAMVRDEGMDIIGKEIGESILREASILPRPDELPGLVKSHIDSMSQEEIDRSLEELTRDLLVANSQRQVIRNFIQIKKDIKYIIDCEFANCGQDTVTVTPPPYSPEVVDPFHDF